jgi:alcohol dehydrogenase class IV
VKVVPEIIRRENAKKVVVFTDQGVRQSGVCDVLLRELADISYAVLDDIPREPSYLDVEKIAGQLEAMACDLIVAIGGGSVMDTAKLCSILKGAPYTIRDLLQDPAQGRKQVKTVFLPTTCGTGSEATCNAIVAIPEESVKKGIVNDAMIPDYAVLDPLTIRHLPKSIVAATGVDALAHVVECYTSLKATDFSNMFAMTGAKLIFKNLVRAYEDPDDMEAKTAMMLGAFYGGVAITASGTTAVHALSYPLGGKFHIAHGVSNAILFAPVMRCNRPACEKELAQLCDAVYPECHEQSAEERSLRIITAIEEVIRRTDIPTDLKPYGVQPSDIDFLVTSGSQQRRLLDNNRKELTLEEIRAIYQSVL